MRIHLPEAVVEEDPEISFIEKKAVMAHLGEHYDNCESKIFDRFMVIDLKTPHKKYAVKKARKTLFFEDDE